MRLLRSGQRAAFADRNLDGTVFQRPGDQQIRARLRPGVADRVAEQLADDKHGIPDRTIEDSRGHQISG